MLAALKAVSPLVTLTLLQLAAALDELAAMLEELIAALDELGMMLDELTAKLDELIARLEELGIKLDELTISRLLAIDDCATEDTATALDDDSGGSVATQAESTVAIKPVVMILAKGKIGWRMHFP